MQFFAQNRERVTLLAAPRFVAQLYYAEKSLRDEGGAFDFEVMPLNVGSFARFADLDSKGSSQTFVVADPDDETARIDQLQTRFPSLRILGLGRDVFPALVARNHAAIFAPIPPTLDIHSITLVVVTPRSGSGLLADVLTDIGAGRVMEHLRKDVIEAMKSNYVYDFRRAFQNFLNFASVEGHFGTKLISHFLNDYLVQLKSIGDVRVICSDIRPKVVFLDRNDKAEQTISGYLASRRGLWHVTSDADAERLRASPQQTLDFPSALSRYFLYQQQKTFLDAIRPFFPGAMELRYEEDLQDKDLAALGQRLAAFLGLPSQKIQLSKSLERRQIGDDATLELAQNFKTMFHAMTGKTP